VSLTTSLHQSVPAPPCQCVHRVIVSVSLCQEPLLSLLLGLQPVRRPPLQEVGAWSPKTGVVTSSASSSDPSWMASIIRQRRLAQLHAVAHAVPPWPHHHQAQQQHELPGFSQQQVRVRVRVL